MSNVAAETAACPRCGMDTVRDTDGGCIVCQARAVGEAGGETRETTTAADRARLGGYSST